LTARQKGILLMILSAFFFAVMQIAVSMCDSDIGVMEQIFFRNLISLLVSFVIIRKNHGSLWGEKKYQGALLMRAFMGWIGLVLSFYALRHATQADVTILNKTSPFFITILSAVFLKEKFSKVQIPALILVFLSALLVSRPTFDSSFLPLLAAFGSAAASAVAYTLLRYFKEKVDGMTVIMYFSTFSTLVSLPFMLFDHFQIPELKQLFLLLLVGIFGSLGQIALTYSYRLVKAAEVSIYNQTGIVFSILLGFFVLGEIPHPLSVLGGFIIIGASYLVYAYNRNEQDTADE